MVDVAKIIFQLFIYRNLISSFYICFVWKMDFKLYFVTNERNFGL